LSNPEGAADHVVLIIQKSQCAELALFDFAKFYSSDANEKYTTFIVGGQHQTAAKVALIRDFGDRAPHAALVSTVKIYVGVTDTQAAVLAVDHNLHHKHVMDVSFFEEVNLLLCYSYVSSHDRQKVFLQAYSMRKIYLADVVNTHGTANVDVILGEESATFNIHMFQRWYCSKFFLNPHDEDVLKEHDKHMRSLFLSFHLYSMSTQRRKQLSEQCLTEIGKGVKVVSMEHAKSRFPDQWAAVEKAKADLKAVKPKRNEVLTGAELAAFEKAKSGGKFFFVNQLL